MKPIPRPSSSKYVPEDDIILKKEKTTQEFDSEVENAKELAKKAKNLDDLRKTLEGFSGCTLKKTATNLVFIDGSPDAKIMFVGEAPGAEEDRKGIPFIGPSGQLVDRMLASINLNRKDVLITNTVFWRPPGNRSPTTQEISVCMPFLERLIRIIQPDILVPIGGPATNSLLMETKGITKLRGLWFLYGASKMEKPIDATPLLHPAYLLRSPAQKREAWKDLLAIRRKLDEH